MNGAENKILIIDDDARNIFALTAVLKAKGFVCVSASSAHDGLAILKKDSSIKLVLLDVMMPEMDGYETVAAIRNIPALEKIPVIAVTAQAMIGDREKALNAGADHYISKPVDVDKLLYLLKQYL